MAPTKQEIEQENERLRAENEQLRAELEEARRAAPSPNTRPEPTKLSYGLSAGTVAELHELRAAVDRGDIAREKAYVTDPATGNRFGLDALDAYESAVAERRELTDVPSTSGRPDDASVSRADVSGTSGRASVPGDGGTPVTDPATDTPTDTPER